VIYSYSVRIRVVEFTVDSLHYLRSLYSQIQEGSILTYEPPSLISGTNRFKIGSKGDASYEEI